MRASTTVFVSLLIGIVLLTGTAGALSVTVAEGESDITVEVSQEGDGVGGANVTVSGVTGETPLDGEYVTNDDGRVVFDEDATSQLSGVIHLRVTVDHAGSYKSVLTTFTRGPEAGSTPIGHRISMSLQEPVAGTHGKIMGRLNAGDEGGSEVHATADRIDILLSNLSDAKFRREVLGRDLAAGEISASEFYLGAVKNARRSAMLRGALNENVDVLTDYDDERLRDEGIDVRELQALNESLNRGGAVDTDRRLLEGE
ncbi:hypothetical protein EGH25_01595 [Haladaptatus sp. F3-133]|jgi:hypothetical protein|uniref:Uncharacterized protein n=1 Tax=Halorutilus salinus TaxID=2487751 RepID=A0A9Q4GHQ5_9EURY|nr:hypothetical protein [Halorutilus salinus]MCX2818048.1 hypothetical protein [Halorutilus salinus]